jgi:hypothetical protein
VRIGRNVSGVALLACAVASCRRTPEPPPKPALSAQEVRAVAAAEAFIRQNGYTNQPADPAAVKWDIMEGAIPSAGVPPKVLLQWRRNTVVGQAYGFSRHRSRDRAGWTVYFEHNPAFLKRLPKASTESREVTGRSVEVSPDLTELDMPHMDIILKTAEVVFRRPPQEAEGREK